MKKDERGMALLAAVVLSILLSVVGLALTLSSLNEYRMSVEFENHEKALMLADAGFNISKSQLRGIDLTDLLQTNTEVPRYIGTSDPEPGTYAYRNPIPPLEARSVNFSAPPTATGTRSREGFLTPPEGSLLGSGRYFAKMTDNRDELGVDDPFMDLDYAVYMRVIGVQQGSPSETSTYGSTVKNSVAIVEGLLKRDMSFDIGSPFSVYGPGVNPANDQFFEGNSFAIDGYDHSNQTPAEVRQGNHNHDPSEEGQAAMSTLYDDPLAGDGTQALDSIYNGLGAQQADNLEGAAGPYGEEPSLRDDTQLVRDSENEDAVNIFDPNFMATFIERVSSVADFTYPDGTTLSGSNIQLGTDDAPKITVAEGDLSLSGSGSGSGILIVKGVLNYSGAFDYNGVILVIGDGEVTFGGANKSVVGGLFLAKLIDNGDGTYSYESPSFSLSGNSNFYFRSKSIRMAISLLPMKTLLWREITPEIEPVE